MNLNQAGDAEADVGLWSPSGDGIAYDISNCAGSFLRLELNGADGEFDANSRWCASISGEQGFIPWTDFNTECWSNEGDFYDGATPLRSAMVLVPSDAADEIPFDFCLNGLTIADNPE